MDNVPVLFDTAPLTTREAAEQLKVDRHTIAVWVREGYMRPLKQLPGKNGGYLFAIDEIARIKQTPRPRRPRRGRGV